jgi:hypothetical protein
VFVPAPRLTRPPDWPMRSPRVFYTPSTPLRSASGTPAAWLRPLRASDSSAWLFRFPRLRCAPPQFWISIRPSDSPNRLRVRLRRGCARFAPHFGTFRSRFGETHLFPSTRCAPRQFWISIRPSDSPNRLRVRLRRGCARFAPRRNSMQRRDCSREYTRIGIH